MARLKRGESEPPTHDFPSTTVLDAGGEAGSRAPLELVSRARA